MTSKSTGPELITDTDGRAPSLGESGEPLTLLTGESLHRAAGEELAQANARLEQENARLQALLSQAQVETLHNAEANALASASARELAAIVASSSDAIISKKLDGTIASWNAAAERLFGFTQQEMLGQSIRRLIPFERQGEEEVILARIAAGEIVQAFETIRTHKDGHSIEVSVTVSPLQSDAGEVIGASKIVRDISERRQAEEQRRANEARFHALADAMPQLVWTAYPDGFIHWYNQRWYEYTGTAPDQMEGWGWQSVHDPEVLPAVLERWGAAIATGEAFDMSFPLRGADGVFRSFLTRMIPQKDDLGRVLQWFGTNTEVDALARTERALRESELRTRLATQTAGIGIWQWNVLTGETRWDLEMFRIHGMTPTPDGLVDYSDWSGAVLPEDLAENERILQDTVSRCGESRRAYRIRRRDDGQLRHIESVETARPDAHGQAEWILGTNLDVTERRHAEEELANREAHLRRVIDNQLGLVGVIDRDGILLEIDSRSLAIAKARREQVVGKHFADAPWWGYDPAVAQQMRDAMRRAFAGEVVRYDVSLFAHGAEGVMINFMIAPVFGDDGEIEYLIPSGVDIRERYAAEQKLKSSEERFRGTFENAAVGVAHVALNGGWLSVNDKLCSIVGYSREELLTKTFQDITHPDDLDADLVQLGQVLSGEISTYAMDKRYIRKDGSQVWIALTVSLQRRESGEPDHFISVVVDISAQKDAEAHRELLMRELAHRSKNQLAVVQGVANQTARSASSLDEFRKLFGNRLQGMAISADLIVAQQWDAAPLGELVRLQLQPFGTDHGRLVCEGQDVFLSSDAAESIGLALHELATNCVKYGAWSVPAGVVRVSWTVDRRGAQPPLLKLGWTERGGPAVTPPSREGFGRRVIERMVAQRLGGTVELAFDVEGISWTLSAPYTQFTEAPLARDHDAKPAF